MTTYLLDTNAWITSLRQPSAALAVKLHSTIPDDIQLCSVVLGELLYGVYRSPPTHRSKNLALVADLQGRFLSVPFDDRAADEFGKIKADLTAKGTLIGPNDILIAAIALANGLTLVTHNTAEFSRVIGLTLDDWQV